MSLTDTLSILAQQIIATPTDTTTRLLYADALDEAGEPEHLGRYHRRLVAGALLANQLLRADRTSGHHVPEHVEGIESCLAIAAVISCHLGGSVWVENPALLRGLASIPYVGHANVSESQRRKRDRFAAAIQDTGLSASNTTGHLYWAKIIGHRIDHYCGTVREYGCVRCQKCHRQEFDAEYEPHLYCQSKHGWSERGATANEILARIARTAELAG